MSDSGRRPPAAHDAYAAADESRTIDYETWKASGRTLQPARDTGIVLEGRVARERRRRMRSRRRLALGAVLAVAVLVVSAAGVYRRSQESSSASEAVATWRPALRRTSAPDPGVGQLRAMYPHPDPTPIFARYKGLELRLPVQLEDLTEVGFHQASYAYALHLKTHLPTADTDATKKAKSTHRDLSKQSKSATATLVGQKVVMWRSRPGKPDTAADIGAAPGSDVLAPVSGTVIKVKRYKLYGKYTDYEIHISPYGFPKLDCVMIHITNVCVKPGDKVTAGITCVGAVRKLSDREDLQLGEYTRGGGDHTHIQLNDVTHPDYKGLEGAIAVGGS